MNPRLTLWLAFLGVMIALAVVSGTATAPVAALLIGLFAAALALSVFGSTQTAALVRQSRSALTEAAAARRMSPEAREAAQRARARGASDADTLLLDIGVFTTDHGPDGVTMRRTRSVSLDEHSVRPFVTLDVAPRAADRQAVVRFEMRDSSGQSQYIHEQKVFLRDGQMNILADHQLPLRDNPRLSLAGEWDLRISIDGVLLGAQAFTVSPPLDRRFGGGETARTAAPARREDAPPTRLQDRPPRRTLDAEDGEPLTLEELLRSQTDGRRGRS